MMVTFSFAFHRTIDDGAGLHFSHAYRFLYVTRCEPHFSIPTYGHHCARRKHWAKLAEIWYRKYIWHFVLAYSSDFWNFAWNPIYKGGFPQNLIFFINPVWDVISKIALITQNRISNKISMPNLKQFGSIVFFFGRWWVKKGFTSCNMKKPVDVHDGH